MIDYKDLGSKIRQLRRAEHITQEELAEQIGISHSFMGHIERGSRIASLETLVLICNALKTTPTYLLKASLTTDVDEHAHSGLTADQRKQLSEYLRMAQDALENWDD